MGEPEALALALALVLVLVALAGTLAAAVSRPPWLPEAVAATVGAVALVAVGALSFAVRPPRAGRHWPDRRLSGSAPRARRRMPSRGTLQCDGGADGQRRQGRSAAAARAGLLGRARRPPAGRDEPLSAISAQAAAELLVDAQERPGRPAAREARRGRIEREVIAAAEGMDLLVLARDGDRTQLGPRSLGPKARFVIDHALCRVRLVWPEEPPDVTTIPAPPDPPSRLTRP